MTLKSRGFAVLVSGFSRTSPPVPALRLTAYFSWGGTSPTTHGGSLPPRPPSRRRRLRRRRQPVGSSSRDRCQPSGQAGRGQQARELAPAHVGTGGGAAARFHVRADHVLSQRVVEDVAAVLVEEADALARALGGHQRVLLQPRGRRGGVHRPVEVPPRGVVRGVGELLDQVPDAVVFVRALGVETGERVQLLALEL